MTRLGHYDGFNSLYPSYGGGGYYDDYDNGSYDDYGSYGLNVYASSSSSAPGLAESSASAETADSSSNRATLANGIQSSRAPGQQQPNSVLDLLNTLGGLMPSGGGGDSFDLITSGDQSIRGAAAASDSGSRAGADRASERNVLMPRANRVSPSSGRSLVDSPSVPTSTTTPAPEFVMINPATSS